MHAQEVKSRALELGFDRCGVAPAAGHAELRFFREWLRRGFAGEMGYLERSAERRGDVRNVLASARSVIVAAMIYNTDRPYSVESADAGQAEIARYAWGEDYHDVMGRKLQELVDWMKERAGEAPFEARAYVDTGPVQERVYAQYAGIGWIGKNTCVINPEVGSWLFLSEIICSLALEPDAPALDQCGTCTLCLDACPTGAIVEPYVLDATRCLSYLTIELKGAIPEEHRASIANHVYGCDICQEVCPWNQVAATSRNEAWQPRPALDRPRLLELWERSDEDLKAVLRKSAMTRAKLPALRRNIAVAIGNSGDRDAIDALDRDRPDAPSVADPLVQEHIDWARRQSD